MIFLNGTTGLNTVEDPTSINYDPKTGISDLAEAVNVQITPNGGIERVDGYSLLQSGEFHSIFCENNVDCVVGRTTTLQAVNNDYSLTGIRSGLSGERISFCQVGSTIAYTNGTQNGQINNKVSSSWFYSDPLNYKGREVTDVVPVAEHLDFFAGRIFFTLDNLLCWTEVGLWGLWLPKVACIRLGYRIRMIKHVDNGMFASDNTGTHYFSGKNPHAWQYNEVAKFPAYEWSDCPGHVEGMDIGLGQPGLCALWCSPEGAILGTPNGQIINLNKEKVIYPEDGYYGAGCVLRGYQLIQSIF